jgi:hypothetical protein
MQTHSAAMFVGGTVFLQQKQSVRMRVWFTLQFCYHWRLLSYLLIDLAVRGAVPCKLPFCPACHAWACGLVARLVVCACLRYIHVSNLHLQASLLLSGCLRLWQL